jgi:RND superfamily putative drug exporter
VAADPRLRVAASRPGGDGRTVFGLVFAPRTIDVPGPDYPAQITAAMSAVLPAGATVRVTGVGELSTVDDTGSGSSVLAETIAGGVGALVVLAFVFGSLLALIPLLVAAVAILTTFLIVLGLTGIADVSIPSGVLTPIEVLIPAGTRPPPALDGLPGTYATIAPDGPAWQRGGTRLLLVLPTDEASTDAGKKTIDLVRTTLRTTPGAQIGGFGVLEKDAEAALYEPFPLLLAVISLITFVLLTRAFRSLLLALKAVLLNLLSLAATYGVLVLVWQDGHGSDSLWGVPATGAITFWVPLMCFAFLYGLSMDYEVFILARMREEYDRTGDTRTAVVEGIGHTGRLVTSAALILFLAFVSLSTAPSTDIRILATGLGAGILLDATVVRALLVPATVALFGRWNWWLPGWAARLLRVPASATVTDPERPLSVAAHSR